MTEGSPPLSLPAAGTDGVRAGAVPSARASLSGQAAGAVSALVAEPDADFDRPARRHRTGHIDRRIALIADPAVRDLHDVSVGGVALALFGDDQHAPGAVYLGGRYLGWGAHAGQASQQDRENPAMDDAAQAGNLLILPKTTFGVISAGQTFQRINLQNGAIAGFAGEGPAGTGG